METRALRAEVAMQDRPSNQMSMTRPRYLELTAFADECVKWMEKQGIQREEGCQFRDIVQTLWYMDKGD